MSSRDKPDKESNEEGDPCPMRASWTVYGTISFLSVQTEDESLREQPQRCRNGSNIGYKVTLPVRHCGAMWFTPAQWKHWPHRRRSSRYSCDKRCRLPERSIGPAWVPVAVTVVVGGAAGFGAVVVVVVGNLWVDDDPFRSAAQAQILLSTRLTNMLYWSSSLGVFSVTRASLSSALQPWYNEVHLAAWFQVISAASLWKSAK